MDLYNIFKYQGMKDFDGMVREWVRYLMAFSYLDLVVAVTDWIRIGL